jgi:hypothetical protein
MEKIRKYSNESTFVDHTQPGIVSLDKNIERIRVAAVAARIVRKMTKGTKIKVLLWNGEELVAARFVAMVGPEAARVKLTAKIEVSLIGGRSHDGKTFTVAVDRIRPH